MQLFRRKSIPEPTFSPSASVGWKIEQGILIGITGNSIGQIKDTTRGPIGEDQQNKEVGWRLVDRQYDDGGYSGGSMERPGLARLLQDIDAGRIDTIVVYKVDRLTRSLTDFAKMIERFDAGSVSFVSVTQQFNTTTSMGRLTLNILLSFAQFEREVTGERIRDKIAASKRRGMWMGGRIPLGYDLQDRKLVLNREEADRVREIFRLYLEFGCVAELKTHLDRKNITSKVRISTAGNKSGGSQLLARFPL
jgi:site-specific DNA recombinase